MQFLYLDHSFCKVTKISESHSKSNGFPPTKNFAPLNAFLDYLTGTEPYDHQEEAILELFSGNNVILNTPTGSGKSLVALVLQFKSLCQGRRSHIFSALCQLITRHFYSLR